MESYENDKLHEISDRLFVLMECITYGDQEYYRYKESCGNVLSQICIDLDDLIQNDDNERKERFKGLKK
jgi:hypothetical protein